MSLIDEETFKPYTNEEGLTLARDERVHYDTMEKVREWLASKRVHFEPVVETLDEYTYNGQTHLGVGKGTKFTTVIADHLSQFNGCPLKALKSKQQAQRLFDAGDANWNPRVSDEKVVIFSMGYVFQEGIQGDSEVALWRPYSDDGLSGGFYFSPDAVTAESPHQIKTTRKSMSTKADREITVEAVVKSGARKGEVYQKATGVPDPTWSVEKGVLEKFHFYWPYEKQSMYLFGRNESYITFWWMVQGPSATFKLSATDEVIAKAGEELEARIRFQREHQIAGTLPGPESRLDPGNCHAFNEPCEFLSEEPCMSTIPLLDMGLNG
jgi:hypothetical protein